MIRCIRIWSNDRGSSNFEEGFLELPGGKTGDAIADEVLGPVTRGSTAFPLSGATV